MPEQAEDVTDSHDEEEKSKKIDDVFEIFLIAEVKTELIEDGWDFYPFEKDEDVTDLKDDWREIDIEEI